jgi:hypothetical protein
MMPDGSGVRPRLTGLALGDAPKAWEQLGFAVVDDRVQIGGVVLHLTGAGGGILGWQLGRGDVPIVAAIDGLPSAVTGPPADLDPVHRNGVAAVDHVVVATPDHDRTSAALAGVGLASRRTVDAVRGDVGTRYRFTLLGTCVLEAIGPREPGPDDVRPARFVGLALAAPDLTVFGDRAGAITPAVQPGRSITTLRTRELGIGVPLAVLTPRPPRGASGDDGGQS